MTAALIGAMRSEGNDLEAVCKEAQAQVEDLSLGLTVSTFWVVQDVSCKWPTIESRLDAPKWRKEGLDHDFMVGQLRSKGRQRLSRCCRGDFSGIFLPDEARPMSLPLPAVKAFMRAVGGLLAVIVVLLRGLVEFGFKPWNIRQGALWLRIQG